MSGTKLGCISGFNKLDDNRFSMEILFEIRTKKGQKVYEDLYKEMTQLLTRDNFRMCNVLNVLEFNSTVQKNAIVHDEDGKL
ncbi:hypothetical protein Bca52824_052028 [Brassica carinata]|uniref:Uncharacterized protein n=1 Tax=Brassica carinata TaxID=52824 RepID=A0A8X7R1B5_BRACI|nr:hypothetical protein Bca52824_052028 [Brassica carinata]